ncbi:MAG: glycosyltransferase family 39 protein [Fimbriimonadaceae bacterium]|nr:glycosyltransferase family 39 protein [Fimbriimonadaceae bacterium]
MREHGWILAIAVLFVVWCGVFASVTPYRTAGVLFGQRDPQTGEPMRIPDVGAPDERQHANYAAHLMSGQGIPVLKVGDFEGYQAHQPPTYYFLLAAWTKLAGADLESPSDGLRLRSLNILIGLATLAAIYLGARWAGMGPIAAAVAGSVMLIPMVVALHAAVSNDPLLYCLVSWSLALLVRLSRDGWSLRGTIALGTVAGLAFVTKTTAIALLPCLVAGWLLTTKGQRPGRYLALALGIALVIAMPWWVRNTVLYGDPLAQKAFREAFVGSPAASTFIESVGPVGYWAQMVGWWTLRSVVGAFGYLDLFMLETKGYAQSSEFYVRILAILAVPFLGCFFPPPAESPRISRPATYLSLLLLGLVMGFFVLFNMTYFQGQGRYVYPAVAAIAWLWAEGMCRVVRRPLFALACALVLFTILDVVAWQTLVQGFPLRTQAAAGSL